MRKLIIGDIHGGLKGLQQVLTRAQLSGQDELIFLGDYVDGWSESAQVIDFLIELDKKQHCTFILGNHDVWCQKWLNTDKPDYNWHLHGGESTMESYKGYPKEKKLVHIDFFNKKLKHHYIDEENRLFIHAGFSSMHGPQQEHYDTNFYWDRTLWELAVAMDSRLQKDSRQYPKRLKLFKEIFIGHTPTLNYKEEMPMHKVNVWNIDTGASFTGKLSCMDIDTKEIWQSDTLTSLYPNEKGRNK